MNNEDLIKELKELKEQMRIQNKKHNIAIGFVCLLIFDCLIMLIITLVMMMYIG